MKWRNLVYAASAAAGVWLVSCAVQAETSFRVDSVAIQVIDSMVHITTTWKPGADDGKGALDGFLAYAYDTDGKSDSVRVGTNVRTATIILGPYSAGATPSGKACVIAERRKLSSTPSCQNWSATISDVAPPPPILDSIKTSVKADSLLATVYYHPGASDGLGASTLMVSAGDNGGKDTDSASVPSVAGNVTFYLTGGYTPGQTVTGFGCVKAVRGTQTSTAACKGFTQIMPDVVPKSPIFDSLRVVAGTSGKFVVRSYWHYQADAAGSPDSVWASVGIDPNWSSYQLHKFGSVIVKDTFVVTSAGPGIPMTGTAGVRVRRRGLESAAAVQAWSYTEQDVPPPPPILDSTTVEITLGIPDSPNLATDAVARLCPVVKFTTGQYARYSKATATCVAIVNAKYTAAQRTVTPKQQAIADSEVVAFTYRAELWPSGAPVPAGVTFTPITNYEVYFRAPTAGEYLILAEGRKKSLGTVKLLQSDFVMAATM